MRTRVYLGILILLAFVAMLSLPAHAQLTTITMTSVQNGDGLPLALGTTCWTGTNNAGTPIAYRAGSSGQVVTNPVCRDIINGAVTTTYKGSTIGTLKVADTTLTTPANVCYKVTVVDSSTGKVVLGSYAGAKSGYDCVQPSGSTWSFDTYTPAGTPNVVQVAGPTGPQGPAGLGVSAASDINFTGNDTVALLNGSTLRGQTLNAFGDSITCAVGASVQANGYIYKVATARGYTLNNLCVSGDTLLDLETHVYGYTPTATSISSALVGQNDTGTFGDSSPSQLWLNSLEATAAYLLMNNKLTGQASAVTKTGSWTNSTVSPFGVKTSTNGDSLSFTVNGTAMYIVMHAVNGNASSVNVTVDGASVGTYTPTLPTTSIKGVNHSAYLIPIRFLSNKPHTVTLTASITSGTLYFDWAAGNLNQTASLFLLSPYRSSISATAVVNLRKQWERASRELVSDGLRLFPVDTQAACDDVSGTALCNGFDGTHPNDAGHAIIANTVLAAMGNFEWKHPAPTQVDSRGTMVQHNGLAFTQDFILPFNVSANSSVKVTVDLSPDSNVDGTPKAFAFEAEVASSFQNREYARYNAAGVATSPGTLKRLFVNGTESVVLGEIANVDNTTIQFTLANTNGASNQRGVLKLHFFANDDYSVRNVWLGTEYTTTFSSPATVAVGTLTSLGNPTASGSYSMGGFGLTLTGGSTQTVSPFTVNGNASNAGGTTLISASALGASEKPFSFATLVSSFTYSSGGNPTLTPVALGTATTSVGSFGYRFQGSCGNGTSAVFDTYTPQVTYGSGANPLVTFQIATSGGCSGARTIDFTNWSRLRVAQVSSGSSSNTDLDGVLTAAANSASYTFTGTYSSHPICTATDETTATSAIKVSYTGTTAVTFTTPGATDVIDYICHGRN